MYDCHAFLISCYETLRFIICHLCFGCSVVYGCLICYFPVFYSFSLSLSLSLSLSFFLFHFLSLFSFFFLFATNLCTNYTLSTLSLHAIGFVCRSNIVLIFAPHLHWFAGFSHCQRTTKPIETSETQQLTSGMLLNGVFVSCFVSCFVFHFYGSILMGEFLMLQMRV